MGVFGRINTTLHAILIDIGKTVFKIDRHIGRVQMYTWSTRSFSFPDRSPGQQHPGGQGQQADDIF